MSPFLFILVLDELLEMIDMNKKLGGVEINEELIKGFAFADDNYTALVDSHEHPITEQIKELMTLMKQFKKISGLDINVSKSEILTNNDEFKEDKLDVDGIEIKKSIKALGVEVGKNVDLTDEITAKINKSLSFWKKKKLNYIEKIYLVNFIIIPKVTHIMRHCKLDENTCKVLKKSIKEFVFDGSKKVGKNEVIHSKIANGGWGLRCI